MAFAKTETIWMNGRLVPWDQATVHVLSHVVHYGSCIFDGIRCYKTERGPAVFRLRDHVERLFDGCRIYRMEIPYMRDQIEAAILETIRANRMEACYIRPLVFRGYESLGVDPFPCPIDVAIAVWPWGAYLGKDANEKGVDVKLAIDLVMKANAGEFDVGIVASCDTDLAPAVEAVLAMREKAGRPDVELVAWTGRANKIGIAGSTLTYRWIGPDDFNQIRDGTDYNV